MNDKDLKNEIKKFNEAINEILITYSHDNALWNMNNIDPINIKLWVDERFDSLFKFGTYEQAHYFIMGLRFGLLNQREIKNEQHK